MTPKRRDLILRVADGYPEAFPVLHQLDGFVHAERMFSWLVQNNITGKAFFDIYLNDFKCSWLNFGKWIVMKVNKESEFARVISGKDYIKK